MPVITESSNWFEVDRKGLGLLRKNADKSAGVFELIQNAFDTDSPVISVTLKPHKLIHLGYYVITVEDDDPNGFLDLAHAYTLFAESNKKADATKRGRFNVGEKFALVMAEEASITTRTGRIEFSAAGRKSDFDPKCYRSLGSEIELVVQMTSNEVNDITKAINRVIVPEGRTLLFNGIPVFVPLKAREIRVTLPTVIANENGEMTRSRRQTTVNIYESDVEKRRGWVYEMGIPITEIEGDPFIYDVQQKVPLTLDRANVLPGFMKALREEVFNALTEYITPEASHDKWVVEGLSNPQAAEESIKAAVVAKFGDKAVSYDPSDSESNKLATASGYQVVAGGSLTKDQWANVRRVEALQPSTKVTPSNTYLMNHAQGEIEKIIPESEWTNGMRHITEYSRMIARHILPAEISVNFTNEMLGSRYVAKYGMSTLTYNVGRLGYAFFDHGVDERVDDLLIHELGHHFESDHLSESYYNALSKLGARLKKLALEQPELFK